LFWKKNKKRKVKQQTARAADSRLCGSCLIEFPSITPGKHRARPNRARACVSRAFLLWKVKKQNELRKREEKKREKEGIGLVV
jgi:hypothetical protein